MTTDIEGLCFTRDGEPVASDWKGYDRFATSQGYREESSEDE